MPIVLAYLLVFLIVGLAFVFVNLCAGSLLRSKVQNSEKDIPYECGEDPIGSAWVQFDLRFYVVALLFVVFEVELVFFFPWATLFGKLNALSAPQVAHTLEHASPLLNSVAPQAVPGSQLDPASALNSAWLIFIEMLIFLGILLIAYAYLWRRGDLNWVRASAIEQARKKIPLTTLTP